MLLDGNTAVLDSFKTKINYTQQVASLKSEPAKYLNWPKHISKLNVNGTLWENMGYTSTGIYGDGYAQMQAQFEHQGDEVTLIWHVYSNQSTDVIFDLMLEKMSMTSMPSVAYKYYPNGPGNRYFGIAQMTQGDSHAMCLHSNIIFDVSSTEDNVDVQPIVQKLIDIVEMESRKTDYQRPPIKASLVVDQNPVRQDELVTITINADANINLDSDILLDDYQGILSLEEESSREYKLRVLQAGNYRIAVRFIDMDTLYTDTLHTDLVVTKPNAPKAP